MLKFLTDEQMSHVISEQLNRHFGREVCLSVLLWRSRSLRSAIDIDILKEAHAAKLTLVTYDQRSIMPILIRLYERGFDHGGILFVDNLTYGTNEFGGLVRALTAFYETSKEWDWTNRLAYLPRPSL